MKRDEVISVLRSHRPELERLGVRRAALFGSVARNAQRPDSDIDILVDLDPEARLGVFEYMGIVEFIQSLFSAPVDVANSVSLRAFVRPAIEQEAVYAF
ncbi:nucleotidyltransferase family protein [Asticcacaulis sp. AND118]|uniref:nucleotidyltransferase family protein n=1 Tax=Asticcacaulis sp. AND118 TaxID=2840468 RepID=UPI001CFFA41F|nr:nucleotidyltransferase family protein [Asticcacaulis sp. AND118]UDF03432.1 nucleotidyltransferase family protein [Asticcacaulis sp. AND118]